MTLCTKTDVASMMMVTNRTVDRWIALNLIPFYKVGNGAVRFDIDEILQHTREDTKCDQ